jgi:hypothetical protein
MWFSLHLFKELAEELISLPSWRQEVQTVRPNLRMSLFDNSLRIFNNKKHEIFNKFQGLHLHIGQLRILRQSTWAHPGPCPLACTVITRLAHFFRSPVVYMHITNIPSSLHEGVVIFTSPTHPHAQSAMWDVGSCTNAASRKGHWITKVASPRIQRDLGGPVIPQGWRNSRSNPPMWVFWKICIFLLPSKFDFSNLALFLTCHYARAYARVYSK